MEHRLTTLVRSQSCKIDRCTCGAVHITVGGTTVRVKEEASRDLRDALVHAVASMDAAAAVSAAPAVRLVPPGDDDESGGTKIH